MYSTKLAFILKTILRVKQNSTHPKTRIMTTASSMHM